MGATGNGGVVSLHVSPGQVAAFSGNANEFLAGIGMQCFREDETDREKFENEEIQALRNGTKGGRVSMEDTGQASSPPPPLFENRTEIATGEVGLLSSFSSSMRVWAWFSSRFVALALLRVCIPSGMRRERRQGRMQI